MKKKNTFTTTAIDQLIDESVASADKLKNELQTINMDPNDLVFSEDDLNEDDYLAENDKSFAEKKDIIDKSGEAVPYTYIYKKLGDLVDAGTASLQMLQTIDPDYTDASVVNATATLINSIRGCMTEFTKIHQQWIRFQQTMRIEEKRLANRKELYMFKHPDPTKAKDGVSAASELFGVSATDIMEFLLWKKEKEEKEKEKKEKI